MSQPRSSSHPHYADPAHFHLTLVAISRRVLMAWNTESTSVAHVKPQLRVLSKPLNVISVEHNTVRTTENARIVIALEHRLTPDVVVPRLTDSLLLRSKAVVLRL